MKEPKRYCCGNGEGMFEDDKNGHWVEYSEHEAIVEALTEQLRKHTVVGQSQQLSCPRCKSTNILTPDKDNDAQCIECAFIWAG